MASLQSQLNQLSQLISSNSAAEIQFVNTIGAGSSMQSASATSSGQSLCFNANSTQQVCVTTTPLSSTGSAGFTTTSTRTNSIPLADSVPRVVPMTPGVGVAARAPLAMTTPTNFASGLNSRLVTTPSV